MKVIDIHTKKEAIEDKYKKSIESESAKQYVFQNIDFDLTIEHWRNIDKIFADAWNNKIGIGGYFYWDEISKSVLDELKKRKILIEYERVDKIVTLMLTYIENNNGFLDDN